MHLSAPAKRLVFLLAFVAASMFATMLYYLLSNSLIEVVALPRFMEISKELAKANNAEAYLKFCRLFVESMDQTHQAQILVHGLLRVSMAFMIVGCGLLFLLSMRLLRLDPADAAANAIPGRFSPARGVDFLINLWEGKAPLWLAFWAFALPVAVIELIALPLLATQLKVESNFETLLYFSLASGIAMVCYLFSLSVIWRCARNTTRKLWEWLARTLVVLLVAHLAFALYGVAQTIGPILRGLRIL